MLVRKNYMTSAMMIAGTVLIATGSAAFAGNEDRTTFKEFRLQNSGMDRHAARALYRETVREPFREASAANRQTRIDTQNAAQTAVRNTNLNVDRMSNHALVRQFNRTNQVDTQGNFVKLKSGIDLDLTSNTRNITLGKKLFGDQSSIDITTDNGTKTVSAGSQVTAAEYVAVKQALNGGQQLTVDHSGRATGGVVDLDAITGDHDVMRASNFVVANNVTTSGDFSKRSDFRLLGDLSNFGTVLALSGSNNVRQGAIRAENINNYRDAIISSNTDLTLDAAGNLNNAGTISSTGGLTLSAGNAINNYGSVSAANDVNLEAPKVNNHATIASSAGNVNLRGASDAALVVNNYRGTISAANGAINLRDSSYTGTFDSTIGGGDLLSSQFNMNAGQGTANVDVNRLTGMVNQTGTAAHLVARTDILNLGNVCLTGDPTYFNTLGSVVVDGNLTAAEQLVIVASGDIIVGSGFTIRAGSTVDATGFDITLIAGAQFTNTGGQNRPDLNDITAGGGAGAVSLTGKSSKTGGNITMGTGSTIAAQGTGSPGDDNGGDVSLFAFDGKGVDGNGGGLIDTSGGSIRTGGTGAGFNGSIRMTAGASKPSQPAIIAGDLDTTGSSSTVDGYINLRTADVVSSNKKEPVAYDATGVRTSTSFLTGADKLQKNSDIFVDGVIESGVTVEVLAGKNVLLSNTVTANLQLILSAGQKVIDTTGSSALASPISVSIFAGGDIGTDLSPIHVDTPVLNLQAGGGFVGIEYDSTGALTIAEITAAKANVSIFADLNAVNSVGPISANELYILADNFVQLADINASTSASFESNSGGFGNSTFAGNLNTPNLVLKANTDIGSAMDKLNLGMQTISAQSSNGSVYLNTTSSKAVELVDTIGKVNTIISANGSLSLISGFSVSATGNVDISTTGGTLSVSQMFSTTGDISLSNASNKGKLAILESQFTGSPTGDISISLGTTSATPMPTPIANFSPTGNVILTGSGLKALSQSDATANSPNSIFINNGGKAGNLTLGTKDFGINLWTDI